MIKLNHTQRMLLGIIGTAGDEPVRFCQHAMAEFLEVTYQTVHRNLIKLNHTGLVDADVRFCSVTSQTDIRFRLTEEGFAALGGASIRLNEKARQNMILRPTYAFGPPKGWDVLNTARVQLWDWGKAGCYTISMEEYLERVEERDAKGGM